MMMEMFGASFAMMLMLPYLMAFSLLPIIIYIVARWRQSKEGHRDSQLGLKVALGFFKILGFQAALAGIWLAFYGLIAKGDNGELIRVGVGLLIPGGLVFAAHHVGIQRTNDSIFPMPVRMFEGLNLVQTGVLGFFSLIAAFVITLQKDAPGEALRLGWSLVLVYTVAWGVLAGRLLKNTLPPGPPPSATDAVVPPQHG